MESLRNAALYTPNLTWKSHVIVSLLRLSKSE